MAEHSDDPRERESHRVQLVASCCKRGKGHREKEVAASHVRYRSEIPGEGMGKKDAPSGTARKLAEIIKQSRNYSKTIYGREGICPRQSKELEVVSMRSGGVPGIHDLIIAGPYEMLKIEHIAFSRSVFAQGALYATKWIYEKSQPGIYSMKDVLR